MKKLENLNADVFAKFAQNEISNISAIVGGAEGNTRGGFDYRDKCTKRSCDPATDNCSDNPNAMHDGGDLGMEDGAAPDFG